MRLLCHIMFSSSSPQQLAAKQHEDAKSVMMDTKETGRSKRLSDQHVAAVSPSCHEIRES